MNPWAFLVIMVGILLIIIGVKGSQHNIVAAITGHAPKTGTTAASTGSSNAQLQSTSTQPANTGLQQNQVQNLPSHPGTVPAGG